MPWGSRSPLDAPIFSVTCTDWGGPGFGAMVSVAAWPDVFAEVAEAEAPSGVVSFFRQEPERLSRRMAAREPRTTRPPAPAPLLAGSISLEIIILGRRRASLLPLFLLELFGTTEQLP